MVKPLMPDLDEYYSLLKDIWEQGWITNNGPYHQTLEKALSTYLKVQQLSLFTNGTQPLITALKALDIQGEVITTPFTFAATVHAIRWCGLTPVFVDIDPETCNMNPERIESAITSHTGAILPVHCYGNPCNIERIEAIGRKHHLPVIYDAAHAFGVELNGKSILEAGDISTISFHATKAFNTVEGGALICNDPRTMERVCLMRNFGINEEDIIELGINSKMDELRAAYGLLNLRQIDEAIGKRQSIVGRYRSALSGVNGIRVLKEEQNIRYTYCYFPIFIDRERYGISRDELHDKLAQNGIISRKYFYPLLSNTSLYSTLETAKKENLPFANQAAEEVLCLPLHHMMTQEETDQVIQCICEV